jgi:tetratricopeptide (TPR) repeat protein
MEFTRKPNPESNTLNKFQQMNKQFIKCGYNITTDPRFQNKKYGVTPVLESQMEYLGRESHNQYNKNIIDKLIQLIVDFPTVPILKNYLSVAYNVQGNYEKAREANNWILAEHPEYLFAKLNQANVFMDNGEFEKVTQILGDNMEIKLLYPDRELFHLAEVTSFYKVAIRYFCGTNNLNLAINRMEILKKIAPGHPHTLEAEEILDGAIEEPLERFEDDNEDEFDDEEFLVAGDFKTVPKLINKDMPHFHHAEINLLYQYGLRIPHDLLHEIIALPRATLIADLEMVLQDAVDRYGYFSELENMDETHSFVLHACFLLYEIKAFESLPAILSFLEYDHKFVDFWLGDHLFETLWLSIYCLGSDQTEKLKQFILIPGIYSLHKSIVTQVFSQIVLHCPERRDEMISVFAEVFEAFINASEADNLIDIEFLGFAIGDTIDCQLHELLPIIKVLFEKEYVSQFINGNFVAVEEEFNHPRSYYKKEIYSIFELYDHVLSTWEGYRNEAKGEGELEITSTRPSVEYVSPKREYTPYVPTESPAIKQAVSEKIGRNDPCPCKSGKKYKKCCGK